LSENNNWIVSLLSGNISGEWRRRLRIGALMLVGTLLALAYVFLQKPEYELHSTMEVGGECGGAAGAESSEAFLDTQMQLLRSDSMRAAAAQRAQAGAGVLHPEVSREGQSRLINILVKSDNPRKASDYVNALVDAYVNDRAARITSLSAGAANELKNADTAFRDLEQQRKNLMKVHTIPEPPERADLRKLNPELRAQYRSLTQSVEVSRRNRDGAAARLQALSLADSGVRIIDRAEPSTQPVARNWKLEVLAGLVLGTLLGLLTTPRNASTGETEEFRSGFWPSRKSFDYEYAQKAEPQPAAASTASWFGLKSVSGVVAAIRAALVERGRQLIVLAGASSDSSDPGMALEIAETLAEPGSKVLLVDCDLAGPLTEKVGLSQTAGLSDYLSSTQPGQLPERATNREHVFLMGNGTMPHRIPALLNKPGTGDALARIGKNYELVLLAAPPVTEGKEVKALAKISDGVVLIASKDSPVITEHARKMVEDWGGRLVAIAGESAAPGQQAES
jgi:hypothetical protein